MSNGQLGLKDGLLISYPKNDDEILLNGAAFVKYEMSLPSEQRLKDISAELISDILEPARAAAQMAKASEAARAIAAEKFTQSYMQTKELLDKKVIVHLKSRLVDHLAEAEQWGLRTKVGPHGVSIVKPRSQSEWINFAVTYVAQEASQLPANRIADPPFEQMQTLATDLQRYQQTRDNEKLQRRSGVQTRTQESQRLLDLLQTAADTLILIRFDGHLCPDLEHWGFTVTAHPSKAADTPPAPAH